MERMFRSAGPIQFPDGGDYKFNVYGSWRWEGHSFFLLALRSSKQVALTLAPELQPSIINTSYTKDIEFSSKPCNAHSTLAVNWVAISVQDHIPQLAIKGK